MICVHSSMSATENLRLVYQGRVTSRHIDSFVTGENPRVKDA